MTGIRKWLWSPYHAPVFAAIGLAALIAIFSRETFRFRDSVTLWARNDLSARAALTAANLAEPLETGDFRRIHAIGDACAGEGVRLVVLSPPGGVYFDSFAKGDGDPESIFEEAPAGDFRVRLFLPLDRVLAPFRRARLGFLLAGSIGAFGVLLVFFTIYRERVRYRELARVERFRREFIADFSHELKTPLTGILGAADMLEDGYNPELVRMIAKESKRLDALAKSILELSRLEKPDAAIARENTDVAEMVRDAVEPLVPAAAAAGMEVRVEVNGAGSVFVDRNLIIEAVSNLVLNAIRHSRSKDLVVSAGQGFVTVEDHGIGIPAGEERNIFERFRRLDASRASSTGGSGLGLPIVRRIARLHGGDVEYSRVKPAGSRFTLRFLV